jgi:2-polyprenyl-3-methyl-5-hydroxy-6-metoxy-1,4-benzoquinol methylase
VNPEISRYSALNLLLKQQLDVFPEHEKFLTKRFASTDFEAAERVAQLVVRISPDAVKLAQDYRWLCERLYEEELHFRRTGGYRLSSFEDAIREVYGQREYMARYMNGLLVSQVWWENHTRVIDYYSREFLRGNRDGYRHLEIGPGHGLLLYFAARDSRAGSVTGWDLSDASLSATSEALRQLETPRLVSLEKRDLFDAAASDQRFDSLVISEVCEHLEAPEKALRMLLSHLAPGGRLLVNVPVNSPAPDHIYLLKTPEEAVEMVRNSGYDVVEHRFFPMTGATEEEARRKRLTISCVIVGTARQ